MKEHSRHNVGLIVGSFMGLFHLVWAVLVVLGLAQVLMDWIYSLHFLTNPFVVVEFSLSRAILLVLVTFVVGYIFGWVFTALCGVIHKKK